MDSRSAHALAIAPSVLWSKGFLITLGTLLAIEGLTQIVPRVPVAGAIMVIPVAYAAFTGGLVSGLTSAALVFVYALYRYAIPGQFLQYTSDNVQTITTLTIVAVVMVVMVGKLKHQVERLIQYNQLLLHSAGEGICGLDAHGRITFVNPAAATMSGWRADDLIGQSVQVLLQPKPTDDDSASGDHSLPAAAGDLSAQGTIETVFWRRDGTSFPVEYISAPLSDNGRQLGAVLTFNDITARTQAEAALRLSEERFAKAFRASPAALTITRRHDGCFIDLNESFERMSGYQRDELIGRSSVTLTMLTDLDARAEVVRRLQAQEAVRGFEATMRTKSGELRHLLFSAETIDLDGEACILTISIDITDRIRAEAQVRALNTDLEQRVHDRTAELEAANQALEQASLAKDRFLASMSHELRTPLNAIIGFTGTLLMKLPGPLTAGQDKQLQTIQTSAKHLLDLINDILDLAKIESGKVELRLVPVVCQTVIEEIITTLRPLAEAKGLALRADLPSDDLVLATDRRALSQILINLVNNAIKFTDAGEVRIELAREAEASTIRVTDTGIGISADDQARLFQEFGRVGSKHAQDREGTGLGLRLSSKLASLLGGEISVQSELGTGSTFTVRFASATTTR
ncbi:MAG TPA: PAS domain S-box protein [Roseiflexaceae bacterium]|nr:PAS domain S-box protein [Roseiflexaceae bacterium]